MNYALAPPRFDKHICSNGCKINHSAMFLSLSPLYRMILRQIPIEGTLNRQRNGIKRRQSLYPLSCYIPV